MTRVRIRIGERELEYEGENAAEFAALARSVFGFDREEAPELDGLVAAHAVPDDVPPAVTTSTEDLAVEEPLPRAERLHGGRRRSDSVVVAASMTGGCPCLVVYLPHATVAALGFNPGMRVRAWYDRDTRRIGLAVGDTGPKLQRRFGRLQIQFGGKPFGLARTAKPGEICKWEGSARAITIVPPSWWPRSEGNPGSGGNGGRAREAAPEAPPVPVKIAEAPSQKAATAHPPAPPAAPKDWEKIDGGSLIPVAEREFFCHTCEAAIATISCDTCEALLCPSCWKSHLLSHRRPRPELGRQEVARA